MRKKYIIFFDIDQTLYDPENRCVPTSSINAIKKLHQRQDTFIVIATGRAPYMLDIIDDIKPFIDMYVTINGQYIYDEKRIIHDEPMPQAVVGIIKSVFIKHDLHYGFIGRQTQAISVLDDYARCMFNEQNLPFPVEDAQFDVEHAVYQMWAFAKDDIKDKISDALPDLAVVPWLSDGFDVIEKHKSKKEGVLKVLRHLNIPLKHAYAFGDGHNDKEMLSVIPHSFAMGNATKTVKATATYQTSAYNEKGIEQALKRLGFID